jgi:hypothetical protein
MRRNLAWVVAGWLFLCLHAHAAQARGMAALDRSVSPERQKAELELVLADVRAQTAAGERPVVVLDIDDTLILSDEKGYDPNGPPVRGAIKYAKALLRAGATIVYLTGRRTNEQANTLAQLRRRGFPLGGAAHLMMNPSTRWERALRWKERAKARIVALGKPTAFFENEKENIRLFRRQYPQARMIRLNTRSNYPDPGRGARRILVIDDFLRTGRATVRGSRGPRAGSR